MPPPRRYDDGLYDEGTYDGPSSYVSVAQSISGVYGSIVIRFRYEERTRLNALVQDISHAVAGGSIDLDNDRAIIRTAKFQFRGDLLPATFDANANCVAVFMDVLRLGAFDAYQLGLFVLDKPTIGRDTSYPAETWDVDASDVSALLWRALFSSVYRVAAGTAYATAIASLIAGIGLASSIPGSSTSVASDQLWGPGESQGAPVQEMAEGLNWFVPYATATGVMATRARINPALEAPAVAYDTTAEPRMILDEPSKSMTKAISRTRFPNRVAVVVDDPLRGGFYAIRQNDDPQSAISTVTVGQTITKELQMPRVVSVAVADSIADYELRMADADSQPTTIDTLLDPRRAEHETYRITFETAEVGQLYRVAGWNFPLKAGGVMTHKIRKIRNILTSQPA